MTPVVFGFCRYILIADYSAEKNMIIPQEKNSFWVVDSSCKMHNSFNPKIENNRTNKFARSFEGSELTFAELKPMDSSKIKN